MIIADISSRLAATLLADMTKGIFKSLFSKDQMKAVLEKAYQQFKTSVQESGKQQDKTLLPVFEAFFTDDRTRGELKVIFEGQSAQVDFTLLDEIFVQLCSDQGIELGDFNFFQFMKEMIVELETLAQQHEEYQETLQTEYLKRVVQHLEKPGTERNLSNARLKYLQQLIQQHNRLVFTGIPDLKEKKDIPLPEVFVMQRARESVPVEEYERLFNEKIITGDEVFTGHELQVRRLLSYHKEEKKEPVKFDEVLNDSVNRRFVILGKPGSGKSSLVKFLMLAAAQKLLDEPRQSNNLFLPILVEIRRFERALSKTTRTDYNILNYLYDVMSQSYNLVLPPRFFETWLESGRVLLMFDGLDEVAAESRRAEIRHMIASFVAGHKGNTVIVTSRITGYNRAQFSTTDYRHFTLEDFDDEEIVTFIGKWYTSRLTNPAEVKTKVTDLQEALAKKPRIKELARNPLLLTIIGIIHRYEAQLPEDRLVLYDKATEAMLYTWDNVKDIIDEKFKPADKRLFLEKVAFHLQSVEKGDEAGTVLERLEVYNILFPDFCRIFCCDNRHAKGLVDEFLDSIRSRAGLLTEQAPDQFGFVHKTFQEYFAAQWIANESLMNYDLQIVINYVDTYIDNAFWQETLLLAIRALPNKQALKVLEHILKRDQLGIEADFYHNHYFVMKFLAEQAQWLDSREVVEKIFDDFFAFSWNEGRDRGVYSNSTWERFKKWVATVTDSLAVVLLTKKLVTLAEDQANNSYLRCDCAEALGNLGLKEKAAEILLTLAQDQANDGYLRRICAEALGNLGLKEKAAEILLTMAQDQAKNGSLRRDCAEALGNLDLKEKAAEILLPMAQDQANSGYLRYTCAEALGNLGLKEKAAEILLTLAQDQANEGYIRSTCAEALGNLGLKEKAAEILLTLAQDQAKNGSLRRDCAKALGDLGLKEKAAEILLTMAQDQANEGYLRYTCAEALGNLGLKEKAAEILLTLAQDQANEGYLRYTCAQALGNLGLKEKAVAILIDLYLAQTDKMEDETQLIYESLWRLTTIKEGS